MDDELNEDIDKIVSVYETGRPRTGLYAGAAWFRGIPHRKGVWLGLSLLSCISLCATQVLVLLRNAPLF